MSELKPCQFCECPIGMFEFRGNLFLKSEYGSDAYCISSGELFWGGTHNSMDRDALIVHPVDYDEILDAWNRRTAPANEPLTWVPVSDRLPEIQQRVLVRCDIIGTTVGWIMYGKWVTDLGDGVGTVTDWMPLPECSKTRPPERSKNDG